MHVWTWIACGLLAGWLARLLTRAPHWGLVGDLALGSVGGALGGWLFRLLGVTAPEQGPTHVLVASVGAAAAVGAMRAIDRAYARARGLPAPEAAPGSGHLEAQVARLGELERRILAAVLRRSPVARDPNASFDAQLTLGQRVADAVARFGGSWPFMGLFAALLLAWMVYNTEAPAPFDPYPYILLNLVLSCLAAIQAPVIMMSQNRLAAKDRADARHDYEVNLKAELEITQLHAKLDDLLVREWRRLLTIQQQQIEALARIERRLAVPEPG